MVIALEISTLLRPDTVNNGRFVSHVIFSFLHSFSAPSFYSIEALTDEKKPATIDKRSASP